MEHFISIPLFGVAIIFVGMAIFTACLAYESIKDGSFFVTFISIGIMLIAAWLAAGAFLLAISVAFYGWIA